MGRITKENYEDIFSVNRSIYNKKIRIDEQSFINRGLMVMSYGFTKFYIYCSEEIRGTFCVNVQNSEDYDYANTDIDIVVALKDNESFIIQQNCRNLVYRDEIALSANNIDLATVIEVSARGDIPRKKSPANHRITTKTIRNKLYSIDYPSFDECGFERASVGLKEEKVTRKYRATVLIELSVINVDMFSAVRNCLICAAIYDSVGFLIDAGQTHIPCATDGNQTQFAKIVFESSSSFYIRGVKVFMTGSTNKSDSIQMIEEPSAHAKPCKPRKTEENRGLKDDDDVESDVMDDVGDLFDEMLMDIDDDDFSLDDIDVPSSEEIDLDES